MKLIKRTHYLEELKSLQGIPDIKVITGVRRCGKSKLMEQFIEDITESDPQANIIHINFNLTEFERLLEYHALEEYVRERYQPEAKNYLLIDEVQMCLSFEKAINSLYTSGQFDIYVTGSNAFLQSSDLATLFVGRTYEVHVFPFSFAEYVKYYQIENIYTGLTSYLQEGGMAGAYLYKGEAQKARYINTEVLNALVVRDIVNRYRIRNEPLLHRLIDFMMDNIGNLISIQTIVNTLASNGIKADQKTIEKYLQYLCRAFAFYRVRRYDIKGKKYLRAEEKYYLCDQSFRYARLGTKNMDYGHVLENAVAIELLRRGFEVYVGILREKEIDFVAVKQGSRIYVQVAYDISAPNTLERELKPLLAIQDAYPKMIIARTYQPEYQVDGVRIVDAAEWMKGED